MPDRYYIVSADYDPASGTLTSVSVSCPDNMSPAEAGEIVRLLFRASVEHVVLPPHGQPRYDDTGRAETRIFDRNENGGFLRG